MIRKLLCWLGWHEWKQRCIQPKSLCHRAVLSFWGQKIKGMPLMGLSLCMEVIELQKKLDIAIKGLKKIKHIGEAKKLGAVYQTAERTLAKIEELK